MVSVIIPVYNAEPYLRACLDSVLASAYQNFELLLVNDGSTDGSLAICEEYAARDSRVALISQENRGVSAARNRGLDVCRGEWVVFVDADDRISPDFLGLVVREEYREQDLILFDRVENSEDFSRALSVPKTLYFEQEEVPELFRCLFQRRQLVQGGNANYVTPAAKAFRRSLIDRYSIRFLPKLFYGEDTLFNIEFLSKAGHCAYTALPVYYYRFHADSSSHRFNPKLPYTLAELLKEIRAVLEANHLFSSLEKDFHTYTLDNLSYTLAWSVFHSSSTNSYGEKMRVCRDLRNDKLYCEALKHSFAYGDIVKRPLIFLFRMRLYPAAGLLASLWAAYLTWKSRRLQ